MGKRKVLFALALVIALGGFAFFILHRGNGRFSTEKTLPDGTLLRVGEISFTNGSHSFQAKGISGWKASLVKVLPKTLSSRLGILPWGGGMTINGSGIGTNLGFFTFCDGPTANGGFVFTRLEVFDESGNVFDGGRAMGTLGTSSFDGRNMLRIDGWMPPAFPRRGKTLGLRYFENHGHGWQPVAEFLIPNPVPGNYPTWTAEPMPATRTNENLAVTLLALKSGLSKADEERPARTNEIAVTQATLQVVESGRGSNSWRPISVEISDATGNHWMPFPHTISSRHEEESRDVFLFEGALWPGEAAWKMRFELSRIADFQSDEVFTFSGITVPGATQVITLDNTTNIAGSTLRLMAISGTKAEQPGSLKWSTVKDRVNISIRARPLPEGYRLNLLKVTDDDGHEARITREADWNAPERVYGFQAPKGAKQLNFTFALHKSRYVEFLAKPEFVHAN